MAYEANTLGDITAIVSRSIVISGSAVLIASTWSTTAAYVLATRRAESIVAIFESLVGIPTVLIGLLLYMVLNRHGPLGFLNLLFTPAAITIGESILVTPLLIAILYRVFSEKVNVYRELALTLGADRVSTMRLVLRESLPGFLAAHVMAFSRAIGELGIALLVGGNIRGYTRTISTAIALAVEMGDFNDAMILGAILVAVLAASALSTRLVRRL